LRGAAGRTLQFPQGAPNLNVGVST